ncbi:MAG: glycoside hydrolase family 140 protein [Hyphomonadaceae bacterium]|nr:glycoside hydrolase family 140 protein [Hyphomonadaceae bacterium]
MTAGGAPFLLHGDTAWSLISNLTREDAVLYLNDRQTRKFNTVLVELIDTKFSFNAPNNIYNQPPFTTPNDFATPNEAYFAHAAYVIGEAQARGMLVLLTPAYHGFDGNDEGWYQAMVANGATKCRNYGRYVATRFASFNNILWVAGGDHDPPEKLLTRAMSEGIREIAPNALQTAHCEPDTSPVVFWSGETWLNVNNVYTRSNMVDRCLAEYQRASAMPFFMAESNYENDNLFGTSNQTVLRRQAYASLLSGAFGQVFGNSPVWHFDAAPQYGSPPGWKTQLNTLGAQSMTILWNFYSALNWQLLAPDISGLFLTGGGLTGNDRAAVSLASNGSFGVIYAPTQRTLTVNLSRLSGPRARARWFDPSNGAFTTIAGSPFNLGSVNLSVPSGNAGGGTDWVLLLESVA